jgi:hypothetical protein
MFNALKYTQELEQAGFSREQAEASLKILIEVMNENFATKSDLKQEIDRLDNKMQFGFNDLRADLNEVKTELKSEMRELDYKLTIKLGVMLTVAVGTAVTMIKIFQSI